MAVKAKFTATTRTESTWGHSVTLTPVVNTATIEDASFYKATPSGEIQLNGLQPEVAAQFTPGKTFYVDFTEAE